MMSPAGKNPVLKAIKPRSDAFSQLATKEGGEAVKGVVKTTARGVLSTAVQYTAGVAVLAGFVMTVQYISTTVLSIGEGRNGVDGLAANITAVEELATLSLSLAAAFASFNGTVVHGVDGMQGLQGERGERGFNGTDGEQGIQGLQGERGERGFNGSVTEDSFSDSFMFGGPCLLNAVLKMTRIGKLVLLEHGGGANCDGSTNPGVFESQAILPDRFRPSIGATASTALTVHNSYTASVGFVTVDENGTVKVYSGTMGGSFDGGTAAGFWQFSLMWSVS